jgi:hypothetical protein
VYISIEHIYVARKSQILIGGRNPGGSDGMGRTLDRWEKLNPPRDSEVGSVGQERTRVFFFF